MPFPVKVLLYILAQRYLHFYIFYQFYKGFMRLNERRVLWKAVDKRQFWSQSLVVNTLIKISLANPLSSSWADCADSTKPALLQGYSNVNLWMATLSHRIYNFAAMNAALSPNLISLKCATLTLQINGKKIHSLSKSLTIKANIV